MKYQITSDNMTVTSSMEVLTKQKFKRLEARLKHIPEDLRQARVVLDKAPNGLFSVRATIEAGNKKYFSDETDFHLETALINTVEEILRMMEKDKKQG